MSSDTKQLLEDCTYANGCIPGVDCEGCAVEVIMMVLGMMVKRVKALKKETELMMSDSCRVCNMHNMLFYIQSALGALLMVNRKIPILENCHMLKPCGNFLTRVKETISVSFCFIKGCHYQTVYLHWAHSFITPLTPFKIIFFHCLLDLVWC